MIITGMKLNLHLTELNRKFEKPHIMAKWSQGISLLAVPISYCCVISLSLHDEFLEWRQEKLSETISWCHVLLRRSGIIQSSWLIKGLWKRQIRLRDVSHGSLFVESVFKNSLSGFRTGVCGSDGPGRPISSSGPQEGAPRIDGRCVWRTHCRPPAWPCAPFAVKIKTEQQKHQMTGSFLLHLYILYIYIYLNVWSAISQN